MNNPSKYYTDGSYSLTSTPSVGAKIVYGTNTSSPEHSGIITANSNPTIGPIYLGSITIKSKWGSMGLYSHKANYLPYSFTMRYYK